MHDKNSSQKSAFLLPHSHIFYIPPSRDAFHKNLDILVALTKKESYLYGDFIFENKEDVFRAIHKYKSLVYDSLYNALKPQMSEYVIKSLDEPDDDE